MKYADYRGLNNLVFFLAIIPIAFSSNPVSELKSWWSGFDINSKPQISNSNRQPLSLIKPKSVESFLLVIPKSIKSISDRIVYETDVFAESLFYISEQVQSLSDKNADHIAKSINTAADQTALSLIPVKKIVDQLISDAQIKVSAPTSTPVPAVISAPLDSTLKSTLIPAPSIPVASVPKLVSVPVQPVQTFVPSIPSNRSLDSGTLALIQSEINNLKSQISNFGNQFKYVPTVWQLPPTNTIGIGDLTINPKTLSTDTATVSGTTTTAGLVVTRNAQIDGTTKLNGITYTWPSADGSASQFFQTNGSGTLSWVTVRQATSNSIDFDELVNSLTLDANLTIASAGYTFTITDAQVNIGNSRFTSDTNRLGVNTTSPATVFEVQGTASASYFLTGNTLQVGGFSSAAYSRFGTATTGYASDLDTINDLLISGALEVDGNSFFDGKASISSNLQISGRFIADTAASHSFTEDLRLTGTSPTLGINAGNETNTTLEVGGTASISGATTLRGITYTWPSADGTNLYLKSNGSGTLSWASSGASSNSLDFDEFVDSMTLDANLTINRGASNYFIGLGAAPSTVFEVQGTASASYLLTGNTLQVGGFASVAYNRFGISTLTTNPAGNWITTTNDVLVSGDLYGVGSLAFAGPASISNALFVGTGGKTGNVGIGTTTPGAKLHVATDTGLDGIVLKNSSGTIAGELIINSPTVTDEGVIRLYSSGVEKIKIRAGGESIFDGGNVGIGTTVPGSKLDVEGDIRFEIDTANDTTIGVCKNAADGTAENVFRECSGTPGDLAEWYETELGVEAGDIVFATENVIEYEYEKFDPFTGEALDRNAKAKASVLGKATTGSTVIGIISTSPWQSFGKGVKAVGQNPQPVALVGRVPVKISLENGPIKAGDRLTVSKTLPGYAMKMTESGQSIGIALEQFPITNDQTGKILTFVNLSYWVPNIASFESSDSNLVNSNSSIFDISILFNSIVKKFNEAMDIVFEKGLLKVAQIVADKITAKLIRTSSFEIEDSVTGELYCVKITNGEWEKKKGECGTQNEINTQSTLIINGSAETTSVETTESQSSQSSDATEQANESVTETTPEATPELAAEPSPLESLEPVSTPEPTPEPTPQPAPESSESPTPEPSPSESPTLEPTPTESPTPAPETTQEPTTEPTTE